MIITDVRVFGKMSNSKLSPNIPSTAQLFNTKALTFKIFLNK